MSMTLATIMGDIRIERLDLYVLIGYFVIIMGVGLWAGLKRKAHKDSKGYFLAGSSLTWPIIGMALFIHIGFTLYAGAKVINVLFGIEIMHSIIAPPC